MPLEGISSSGPLIPANQLAEAAALGAFQTRVENSAPIKKPEDNKEAKKEDNNEEEAADNTATGHYTEDSTSEETLSDLQHDVELPKKSKIGYTIKFNKYTELVELIDLKSGIIVHTIPPNDLIALISELKITSGMFVDNKA